MSDRVSTDAHGAPGADAKRAAEQSAEGHCHAIMMPCRSAPYKLRCYPTRGQERELGRWFGHSRWVWNWALDARRKAYRRRGETLTSVDLSRNPYAPEMSARGLAPNRTSVSG